MREIKIFIIFFLVFQALFNKNCKDSYREILDPDPDSTLKMPIIPRFYKVVKTILSST